ncbi:MAG: glutamate synthase central domain-containing protein, partial [Solirubrobacteraceae bacterium]
LTLGGRSLPHAMMMMIPEAWEGNAGMDEDRKSFYRYATSLVEPWDGPAAIVFSDGQLVGATLDRNGLRPARWTITTDDRVILASETGVVDVPAEQVKAKGRLTPGMMFVVDTAEGRIVDDAELKREVAGRFPYKKWLEKNVFELADLDDAVPAPPLDGEPLAEQARAFGYTDEDLELILEPMATAGKEPVGSMGTDTPLAVLSDQAPVLGHYFHQLFAQVTNPPIDSIREEIVISAETRLGSEGNLLNPQPTACRRVELKWPILTNEEFAKIRRTNLPGLRVGVLPILFRKTRGERGLAKSMEELSIMARRMIEEEEINVIILSDRGVTQDSAPIPALLAIAGLHHYLIREGLRTRVSLVLETGEAREVHHFSLLIGYGCSAINPYVAFETIDDMIREGLLTNIDHKKACQNFVKSAAKGVIKVMSKMG